MPAEPGTGLPARPSLEQLRKQAKERLSTLRADDPAAKLADAQFIIAKEYGFESWPQLVHHVSAIDPRASAPRITAPVNRTIGTTDTDRAIGYWRDVLGFEVRGSAAEDANRGETIDLVSGQARIRIGVRDWSPDFADARDPGAAILFLETNDVEAMHAAIRRRGGQPSDLEKVNWIKMRVFQIQDPDGHVIWFGQSYNVDMPARPRGMLQKVMPELPLGDVPAGVRHYVDVLGFSINYEQRDIGVMYRDDVTVLLIARTPQHEGIGSAYMYVRDADALYAELIAKGADVQGEPISRPWGLREFTVLDLVRNRLTFGQPFE